MYALPIIVVAQRVTSDLERNSFQEVVSNPNGTKTKMWEIVEIVEIGYVVERLRLLHI